MELLLPLLIVFMVGMIFVSNRQRKKQAAQQESLQNALAVGDIVVMTSGVSGTIVDVDDERTVDVEIAPDVVTTWLRAAVREKLGGEGVPAAAGHDAEHEVGIGDPAAPVAPADRVAGHEAAAERADSARSADEPAPALETDHRAADTPTTVEGTPSARNDEPSDAPTSGGRRP